jgi:hypothetical protein
MGMAPRPTPMWQFRYSFKHWFRARIIIVIMIVSRKRYRERYTCETHGETPDSSQSESSTHL